MSDTFASESEAIAAAEKSVLQKLARLSDAPNSQKIRDLIEENKKMMQSCTSELSASIHRQLDDHKKVLTCLNKCNSRNVCEVMSSLKECGPNTANTPSFKPLVVAHNNLRAMLEILRPLQNLEETVSDLRRRLRDKSQIGQIVTIGLQLAESKARMMELATEDQPSVLAEIFAPLTSFERDLSDSLWGVIENSLELVKTEPEAIVRVVRILGAHHPQNVIISHLETGLAERLRKIIDPEDTLESLSAKTSEVLGDLQVAKEKLAPCFPPELQVYELCVRIYRKQIEGVMTPFLAKSQDDASPGTIILLAAWLHNYITVLEQYLPNLIEDLQIQLISAKVKELMPDFVSHVESLLNEWIQRVIAHDVQPEGVTALVGAEAELISSLPEEMFSAISQQVNFITARIQGEILIDVFRACASALKSQQLSERKLIQSLLSSSLDSELSIPYLCLRINNMHRCNKHTADLKESCGKHLNFGDAEMNAKRLDKVFSEVTKMYMAVNTDGTNALSQIILRFVAESTIGQAFSEKWEEARPVGTALATFEDFSGDLNKWLVSDYYTHKIRRKFTDLLLLAYVEKLLWTQTKNKEFQYKILGDALPKLPQLKKPKEFKTILTTSFDSLLARDSEDFEEFFQKNQLTLSYLPIFQGLKQLQLGIFDPEISGPALESISPEGRLLANELAVAFSSGEKGKGSFVG